MKKFGKTIKLFLIDGEPNGRMTCELSNWTGKAYKIPRIQIKESYDRQDLKKTGIYLLFGRGDEGKPIIYIGEAETIIDRLKQHISQKEFWNEVILFMSKDENLNKAHVKYLESRLYELAQETNRYDIENSTKPTRSSISESEIAEMEEFIENVRLLTNTLGHKVFEKLVPINTKKKSEGLFFIKSIRGANAIGIPTSSGFVVLKGSEVANEIVPSLRDNFRRMRETIIDSEVVIMKEGKLILPEDYEFSSPSTAATIVMGRNANGLTEWKNKKGLTLKEYEASENS
ncbi:MAG: GIY-YIG nuclease family protein [Bacteroidales bacterium]|nr:GIY-YIG nuclease family protein [Bacteroidales bacterium]